MRGHSIIELGSDDKPSPEPMTVDIDEETVGKLKIGQKIKLVVEGSVGMLQTPPHGITEHSKPSIGIKVVSKKIQAMNEFVELASEDENDGED